MTDEPRPGVVWQARLPGDVAREYERDLETLGLERSEGIREGLAHLHRRAREVRMARDVEEFYGGQRAPLSELTAELYGLDRHGGGDGDATDEPANS